MSSGVIKVPTVDQKGEPSVFTSPSSFEEAWSGKFFLAKALLAVTALGLSVSKIPLLHVMALGGRLKNCLSDWQAIGTSNWVFGVISGGYKIPFKFPPHQFKVPSNPPAEGVAYDILVAEAQDLVAKEAIVSASPDPSSLLVLTLL